MLFFKKLGWFSQGFAVAVIAIFIGCARPAVAEDGYYVGGSAGVSYATQLYKKRLEDSIFRVTKDVALNSTETRMGYPYEIFFGYRKGNFAIEGGKFENLTAGLRTKATFQIANQNYSGYVNREMEVSGFSISGLWYYRLTPNLEGFVRGGGVRGYGIIKAFLPLPHEYDGGMIAYEKHRWLVRAGTGLDGRIGQRSKWRFEVGFIGSPTVPKVDIGFIIPF